MRRLHFIMSICCMGLTAPCFAATPEDDLGSRLEGFQAEAGAIFDAAPPPIIPLSSAPGDDVRPVLRVTNDGSALERQVLDIQSSSRAIVVGHPGCHFCRDAIAAIAADPELARAMRTDAIWLTAPSTSLTDGWVAEWNRENPAYAYYYADSIADWPEISYWGTPSFYFMKDGELLAKVIGWPDERRKEDLRAGFRAIGISVGE